MLKEKFFNKLFYISIVVYLIAAITSLLGIHRGEANLATPIVWFLMWFPHILFIITLFKRKNMAVQVMLLVNSSVFLALNTLFFFNTYSGLSATAAVGYFIAMVYISVATIVPVLSLITYGICFLIKKYKK